MTLKEQRQELRNKGLCVFCEKPNPRSPMWYCQDCADIINQNTNYKRAQRKKNGLCLRCETPLNREGVYCKKCVKAVTKSTKKSNRKRRKEGYCHSCYVRQAMPGSSRCKVCALKYDIK